MHTCSNCSIEADTPIVISQGGVIVAALCNHCTDGTKTVKIILKRDDAGVFACEQYAALEMINKAFGK